MWRYKKLKEVTLEKYLDLLNPERQYHIKRGLAALKSVEKKPKKKFDRPVFSASTLSNERSEADLDSLTTSDKNSG